MNLITTWSEYIVINFLPLFGYFGSRTNLIVVYGLCSNLIWVNISLLVGVLTIYEHALYLKCLVFFSKILLSTSAFLPIYDIFVTSYPHLRSKKSSFKKFEAFFIIWKNSTMLYIAFTYTYLELFYCNLCDIKYVS